jgi:phage baseplate assembly protein W
MSTLRHLGKGWAFPVVPDATTGELLYRAGTDKVAESIRIILETEPGERIMRPTFGCGLKRYLMQPNTVATRALIKRDVESALRSFEARIAVTSVDVSPGEDPALVLITISYTHVRDRRPGSFVYPFYLR